MGLVEIEDRGGMRGYGPGLTKGKIVELITSTGGLGQPRVWTFRQLLSPAFSEYGPKYNILSRNVIIPSTSSFLL
jgi:hypothetical protein